MVAATATYGYYPGPERLGSGLRHVTILFSDIAGFSTLAGRLGDVATSALTNDILMLQQIVITRDGLGTVLQLGGDSIFAVFDNASVALNRALEIQRLLDTCSFDLPTDNRARVRIGLHMGEVLVKEGERLEIISRHVNRAHRVMAAANPGQILASDVVVDAARDFIEIPREHQAIRHYGEFYLKGVGATGLCEVADLRFRKPEPPQISTADRVESALVSRLELAGYRSVTRLGEGAFGVVYRAEAEAGGNPVAVKVLHPALYDDPTAREKFSEEVSRTTRLNLPGVVRILDERLSHQPPFFVMELVEGKPADVALSAAPAADVARVFVQICETLGSAHQAGVIHCDLKPGNVMVRSGGAPVLMDFGMSTLASVTPTAKSSTLAVSGTPAFLAPEVIEGGAPSPRSDIYSLGVLLFKVLTGREPFTGETVHQIVQGHLHEDPPPPAVLRHDVPDGLQRICLKALEKNPVERYQTTREMAEDFERYLRGEVVRTRPTVYDNLLFYRVRQHVEQIREWGTRGLLNQEETHRLLSSYEGLQRRGLPAVMEGRLFRLWQTLVYIGGWAVMNGALLWLMLHWDKLTRAGKLLLGSVPAFTTFALAAAMWRMERFRLFFVALIVGILATPLMTGVWLHEFNMASVVPEPALPLELFHDAANSNALTNQQLLITALSMLLVAGGVMIFTRTTTHSAQALSALVIFYSTLLLSHGLRPEYEAEQFARISLQYVPLLALVTATGGLLLCREDRLYQAPPWIYTAAIILIAILYALSLHGLKEWTTLEGKVRDAVSYLLLSMTGAAETVVGLAARQTLRHRCRMATLLMIFVGLGNLMAGFGLAGMKETWPQTWMAVLIFGQNIPLPHVLFPAIALTVTLLACRYQMLVFLFLGLAGLACSVHLLGYLYFEEVTAWPKVLMVFGAVCFFTALYRELRRTRGNTIDDVIGQSRL